MKKILGTLLLLGLFLLPQVTRAQDATWIANMQAILNGIASQINSLQTAQALKSVQTIPTTPVTYSAVTTNNSVTTAGCAPTMMPAGKMNQTVRCNGSAWVSSDVIHDNGSNVLVGYPSANDSDSKLYVKGSTQSANSTGYNAITGLSTLGNGVLGISQNGSGIYGDSATGISVEAFVNGSGYGFYQTGDNARNSFEGNLGLGVLPTTDPHLRLEVNGGIKLKHDYGKPNCDVNLQGTMWFQRGGTNQKDTFQVCAKDAANTYAWRTLY